jgi:hypothetical protein
MYEDIERKPLSATAQGMHRLKWWAVRGIAREGEKETTLVGTLKILRFSSIWYFRGLLALYTKQAASSDFQL